MRLSAGFSEIKQFEIAVYCSPGNIFEGKPGVVVKQTRPLPKAKREELIKEHRDDSVAHRARHRHRLYHEISNIPGIKLIYLSDYLNAQDVRALGFEPIPKMEEEEKRSGLIWKLKLS